MNRACAIALVIISAGCVLGGCLTALSCAAAAETAHVDIWLRNEYGETITPADNAMDPFSPKKTCGACHNYEIVLEGEHFQMGTPPSRKERRAIHLPVELVRGSIRPDPCTANAVYDWIALNSHHHPGGGPMERICLDGVDGVHRVLSLVEAESIVSGRARRGFVSKSTPDGKSHFKASGVLEADCLMCHAQTYDLRARNRQVSVRNYRWACVAGSGLGEVRGVVLGMNQGRPAWNFSRQPVVRYRWGSPFFTPEGKLSGKFITDRVKDRACLMCHGVEMAVRTGVRYGPDTDVHARNDVRCADCHRFLENVFGGRLAHRMGQTGERTARLSRGQSACVDCHMGSGQGGGWSLRKRPQDPRAAHQASFAGATFHLRLLACTACHITGMTARGAYLLDLSTGKAHWFSADKLQLLRSLDEAFAETTTPWRPWIEIVNMGNDNGERYTAVMLNTAQWFAYRNQEGTLIPLDEAVVARAVEGTPGIRTSLVTDRDGRKVRLRTLGDDKEIKAVLGSLKRCGVKEPVFISDKAYRLEGSRLVAEDLTFSNTVSRPIWHGVSPVKKGSTYGSKGCLDCHDTASPFFTSARIRSVGRFLRDGYPEPKQPYAYPQMNLWGFDEVPPHE